MGKKRRIHFLITAGPTREYLDTVRFLSNGSSGRTGYAIAQAAVKRGHKVTLVSGPVAEKRPPGVKFISVTSAAQMHDACVNAYGTCDAVVMTAAVCDYRPEHRAEAKLKKEPGSMSLKLLRTVDILAELGANKREGQVLIGFAMEDRQGRISASRKLKTKKLDAIVLNSPSAMGAAGNEVSVLCEGKWHRWPEMSKTALGGRIVRLAEQLGGTG